MSGRAVAAAAIRRLDALATRPRRVALGMFDGVHVGHREVIRGADCVVTFDPHPLALLAPERAPLLLSTIGRRAELVGALGVKELVVLPFDTELAACPAQRFLDEIVVDALGATHVSVGESFRFGHRGRGDVGLLAADGRFHTRVVALRRHHGEVVSSTAIRARLAGGDVPGAAELLGAPVVIELEVRRAGPPAELIVRPGLLLPGPATYVCLPVSVGAEAAEAPALELQVCRGSAEPTLCLWGLDRAGRTPSQPGDRVRLELLHRRPPSRSLAA